MRAMRGSVVTRGERAFEEMPQLSQAIGENRH